MQFRIQSRLPLSKVLFYNLCIRDAKASIVRFKMYANELIIDSFLKKHYSKGLKPICLQLVDKLIPNQISDNELLFTFVDEEADQIARLITYGDGQMLGSKILIQALTRKAKGV